MSWREGARLVATKKSCGLKEEPGHLSCCGVAFKGSREGLRLVLPMEAEFTEIYAELEGKLRRAGGFFRGATVTLDSRRRLLPEETTALSTLLQEHGLAVRIPKELSPPPSPPTEIATTVRAPVRSGQCVEVEGSLLVLGDVHPGAEVRAGRDVIVLGSARGVIVAGLVSGREAKVFAFGLRPSLLRLGDLMARSPAGGPAWRPEIARVQEGQIVVEPFTGWERTKTRRTRKD
ncbi:MAG: septum site-determining protein MinC [Bacillota bacterium]